MLKVLLKSSSMALKNLLKHLFLECISFNLLNLSCLNELLCLAFLQLEDFVIYLLL